ncbi:MAG: substrate-binding domain-containing protein [Eubacterium sp.]|nr:substrate-binding domain-containing protein [Eubacterium sp.]
MKKLLAMALTGMMVFGLAGCGNSGSSSTALSGSGEAAASSAAADSEEAESAASVADESEAAASSSDSGKKFKIGFSMDYTNNPWRANMRNAVLDAAEEHKDEIELIYTDADADTNKQISDIEDLVAQDIDLLIVSPYQSDPLTPIVAEVYNSGIPVLVLDRNISSDEYTCFLGSSNDLIGQQAGDLFAQWAAEDPDTLNIVELQCEPGLSVTLGRGGEMEKKLKDVDNVNFVAQLCCIVAGAETVTAMQTMEDILQSNNLEDIDVVYSHNDTMLLGAIAALDDAGIDWEKSDIKLVGVDGQKEVLESIIEGKTYGTFQYANPGKESIEAALTILNGGTVDKEIQLESALITAENVDQYYDPDSAF